MLSSAIQPTLLKVFAFLLATSLVAASKNSSLQTMPSGLASFHNGVGIFVKQGAALSPTNRLYNTTVSGMCE